MSSNDIVAVTETAALASNEESALKWTAYMNDLKTTQQMLSQLPENLSQKVMVPLGSRAFMRGKIVHTNEFLVSLGDSYFVKRTSKQSWDICERRIQNCNEMVDKLVKERDLLINKTSLPNFYDAFGSTDRPEIVEMVTEDEDIEWRKQHRQREKEYRQKLIESRHQQTKIENEEDLFKRLDQLELEEELEDELNRLHDGDNSGSEDSNDNSSLIDVESVSDVPDVKPRRRSVVFMNEESPDDNINDPLQLSFKHSEMQPLESLYSKTMLINTPSDFYEHYLSRIKSSQPQSILKVRHNPNQKTELESIQLLKSKEIDYPTVTSGITIPSVTERNVNVAPASLEADGPPRRRSKFKVSRLKQEELSKILR